MVELYRQGKLLIRPPHLFVSPASRVIKKQIRRNSTKEMNLVLRSIYSYLEVIFYMTEKLGADSYPSPGVLRIFVALKNPSPWPDLNPRTLGQMTSTLTARPPRPLNGLYIVVYDEVKM
jgi:hypothetical protein